MDVIPHLFTGCACLRCLAPFGLGLLGSENVHPEQMGPAVPLATASRRDGWQPWATMCDVTLPVSQMTVLPPTRCPEGPCYIRGGVMMHPRCSPGLQQDPQESVMTDL